jgi:two-component system nitrogen regulation sensor histidine kinase NtrY
VVENSATVARSYVSEQTNYISQHVGPMAGTLNQAAPTLAESPVAFGHFLPSLTDDNGFSAAYVLDRDGRILARAESDDRAAVPGAAAVQLQPTDSGDITSQRFVDEDLFRALYRLKAFPDAYLYVARPIDKGILAHLIESEESLISYREAAKNQAGSR